MSRIAQRLQALEKGSEDGADIGELLDLLDPARSGELVTIRIRPSVLKALDALPSK